MHRRGRTRRVAVPDGIWSDSSQSGTQRGGTVSPVHKYEAEKRPGQGTQADGLTGKPDEAEPKATGLE